MYINIHILHSACSKCSINNSYIASYIFYPVKGNYKEIIKLGSPHSGSYFIPYVYETFPTDYRPASGLALTNGVQ